MKYRVLESDGRFFPQSKSFLFWRYFDYTYMDFDIYESYDTLDGAKLFIANIPLNKERDRLAKEAAKPKIHRYP